MSWACFRQLQFSHQTKVKTYTIRIETNSLSSVNKERLSLMFL